MSLNNKIKLSNKSISLKVINPANNMNSKMIKNIC